LPRTGPGNQPTGFSSVRTTIRAIDRAVTVDISTEMCFGRSFWSQKPNPLVAMNPRRVPLRLFYAGIALLILVLLAANAAVLVHFRETDLLHAEDQLKTLSLILAEQAERSFESVDLVISSVGQRVTAEGVTDSVSFDQKMAGHDIYLLLREKMSGVPQLNAVNLFSREGEMVNSSRSWPNPVIHIADRLFFKAVKEDPTLKNFLTEPVKARATGAWNMYLAHRVSGANGEFLGLILGAIELRYFEDFYRAISLGESSSVAILRSDGVTLTRFPRTDTIGKAFSNSERLLHGGISSVSRHVSPIDGQMGIVAVHRLANYPVFALASKSEDAALTDWRSTAWLMSLGALGCSIVIALAGFAFGRQWTQKATLTASQVELRRQRDRTEAMTTAADVARAMALEMTHSAEHDFLTGLANRMLLNDRVTQAIALAQRHNKKVAVLFLDLDGFKHINDSFGHQVGDKLLQSVAKRLVDCVRRSDTVSRQDAAPWYCRYWCTVCILAFPIGNLDAVVHQTG
jgi:Diguanylate cyclase, GGDEF domain/Cache domain